MSLDKYVGRAAVVAASALVGLVVLSLVILMVPSVREVLVSSEDEPAYPVGGQVDVPVGLYTDHPRNILIFARSSCAGCQRAKPLLLRIVEQFKTEAGWHIVFIPTGLDATADRAFAEEAGLGDVAVAKLSVPLRLHHVPTVVVVDSRGRILGSREGFVWSETVEADVLGMLNDLREGR